MVILWEEKEGGRQQEHGHLRKASRIKEAEGRGAMGNKADDSHHTATDNRSQTMATLCFIYN